jgi:hypothetical protein
MSFGIKENRYADEEIQAEEIVAKLREIDVLKLTFVLDHSMWAAHNFPRHRASTWT